jgi:cell division protein FtsI/penicillin-binding protein 2
MKVKKLKADSLVLFFGFFIIISFFSLLIFQLYRLQIAKAGFNHNSFSKLTKIPPLRGNIYLRDKDGNLFLAATSYYLYDLYFYPPKAKNIDKEIKTIFERLKVNEDKLNDLTNVAKNSSKSIILIKNLTDEQKKEIEKLKYDSVFL